MEQVGYQLVDDTNNVIMQWGGVWGTCPSPPQSINCPNGDTVYCPEIGTNYNGVTLVAWNMNPPAPPPAQSKVYDFLTFMALFTTAEQDAIVNSTDTHVKIFLLMVAGAKSITFSDPLIKQGLDYLASVKLLTADRENAILNAS
jgi:hypothetical protein